MKKIKIGFLLICAITIFSSCEETMTEDILLLDSQMAIDKEDLKNPDRGDDEPLIDEEDPANAE